MNKPVLPLRVKALSLTSWHEGSWTDLLQLAREWMSIAIEQHLCGEERKINNMYVAVKGGERAIESAHTLLAEKRRGDPECARLIPGAGQRTTLFCRRPGHE